MSSWNSVPLELCYQILGWVAFFSWSFSFYPQVILNFRRRSVVGLNFDFLLLNLTKHSSYLIYNAVLFFSPTVQKQYHEKYGFNEMIPVAANDVAFSIHAVLLTGFTVFQVFIYERGSQRVSKVSCAITFVVWVSAIVCVFLALPSQSWLWLISVFNTIQVIMTVIKYIPQAILNFSRKSTVGWSIGNILLDLLGGVTSYGQMTMQSIDQDSWVNFYGNVGKTLLSLVSIFFDLLFIVQHYVLYPTKKDKFSIKDDNDNTAPLMTSQSQNAILNFSRKSTVGWIIGNILLDLLGGVTSYGQMTMQSIDQDSWVTFYGNVRKTLLSLVSIFFDLLFIAQHYVLYPTKKEKFYIKYDNDNTAPLMTSQSQNV